MVDAWSYFLEFHGERFELEGGQLTVGRSRSCDISIKDPSVSRRHVRLIPGSGKIALRDLGSSNGTYVNGRPVQETGELSDGDALGLGDADLKVKVVPKSVFETVQMPARPAVPRMGEATSILQAESVKLAQEALEEDAGASPGAHMAPPTPPPTHAMPPPPEPPAPPGEASIPADEPATRPAGPRPTGAAAGPPAAGPPTAGPPAAEVPESTAPPGATSESAAPEGGPPLATLRIPVLAEESEVPPPDVERAAAAASDRGRSAAAPLATVRIPVDGEPSTPPPDVAPDGGPPAAEPPDIGTPDRGLPKATRPLPMVGGEPERDSGAPDQGSPDRGPHEAAKTEPGPPAAVTPDRGRSAAEAGRESPMATMRIPVGGEPPSPAPGATPGLPLSEPPPAPPAAASAEAREPALPTSEVPPLPEIPELPLSKTPEMPLSKASEAPFEPPPDVSPPELSLPEMPDVPESPVSEVPLSEVPLSEVPLSEVPLSEVPLPEAPGLPELPRAEVVVQDGQSASPAPAPMPKKGAIGIDPLADEPTSIGELLPSVQGFDTTLGPGVPVPPAMERARESIAKARDSALEDAAAALRPEPLKAPPMAGFGIRALAVLLDGVWMLLLGVGGQALMEELGALLASGIGLLVVLAGWGVWGTTPGKRLLGLYIYGTDGQAGIGLPRAVLRLLAYFLSGLLLGIGFLMGLSSSRRALHDLIAGTYVRRYR